jgi:sigma-B regulation protein RsbU (phosphoserine phosphatase)
MEPRIAVLEKKISDLEKDLALKEQDLLRYKTELTKANKSLEKLITQVTQELRVASQIQRVLVPTEFPNIHGVEFSTKFIPGSVKGGDYFDIFEHDDRLKFGVLVSCSSGYTMSALFLSVLLKMAGQMEARRGAEPNVVLKKMLLELLPNMQQGKDRSSLFYGVIDRRTFEMKYCQIGNNVVLAVDGETGKMTALTSDAPPIVKGYKHDLVCQSIILNPCDRLIIVSEGVVKAGNPGGEAFGLDRLSQAVMRAPKSGVHEMRNELLYQLEKFSESTEFPEDVTVVVTEVKERILKLARS